MSEGIKSIFKRTKSIGNKVGLLKASRPRARRASHNDKITLWISGCKCVLSAEDWMRGH
jgi:hypothetical protein